MSEQRTTRLAPSPTGALHMGNARTFLANWALARRGGWRIVLRIEDLDTPRTKPGADAAAVEDLGWLGLDWDAGPTRQMADLSPYRDALDRLRSAGLIYPCRCTRRDIEQAASAPHADAHELRYPGTCRPAPDDLSHAADAGRRDAPIAWRLIVPDGEIAFNDGFHGPQRVNVQREVGDFVVATKASLPAYQLAVVVDDARQGVTDVVRGDDLLGSTGRQLLLYHLLGLGPPPRYTHLPLVVGEDGRRLAKRHGDTRLATYRDAGVSADRVVGLLAFWSGVVPAREPMSADEFRDRFDLTRLPPAPAVFTAADHAWLTDR
ncbi:MAG: Glutamate--tRNA ligase [Phycisphaerae bacterium]|nr:Glutamate--tRNA ligase [Phycisphaerae bacterium]